MIKYALLIVCMIVPIFAHAAEPQAMVTFYWPGEMGGKYGSDGALLRNGDAAVDFSHVPKGTKLKLIGQSGTMQIVATDRGGRDVISRKAARERGSDVMVIDVWVKSASVACSEAKMMGDASVRVQYSDGSLFTYSNVAIAVTRKSSSAE